MGFVSGFSKGFSVGSLSEIKDKVSDFKVASYYLGIKKIPSLINSPFREDNNPSLGIYTRNGVDIYFTDFGDKSKKGSIYELLAKVWGISYYETLSKVNQEINSVQSAKSIMFDKNYNHSIKTLSEIKKLTDIQCEIRKIEEHDVKYWASYGISVEALRYSETYPISKIIIKKGKSQWVFKADKYAYVYVERRNENYSLKIYQPFNKDGLKWLSGHSSDILDLWHKIPESGEKVAIVSSRKDALCLWNNTAIPAIAPQGEGYGIKQEAIDDLSLRYTDKFIIYDNDNPGISNSEKLSQETNIRNIIIPQFENGNDISDYYFNLKNKKEFKDYFLDLITINK